MQISMDIARAPMSRAKPESTPKRFHLPHFSLVTLVVVCLSLVGLLGYLDFRTGYEQSLFLFYLVPIALATWFGNRLLGFAFAVASLAAWVASDVAAGVP